MRTLPLVFLVSLGCGSGSAPLGEGEVDGSTEADADTDADTDTDTDADTDADVDGVYSGSFLIQGEVPEYGLSDACVGEIRLEVDAAEYPQVRGVGSCEFEGILASVGEQTGQAEGRLTDDGGGVGIVVVSFSGEELEADWNGEFDGDVFTADFEGSFVWEEEGLGELEVLFSGDWRTER